MDALQVDCRPDERGEPVPVRFRLGSRELRVVETLDRWPGRGHSYVRVRADDGVLYVLRHDAERGTWSLHSLESPADCGC